MIKISIEIKTNTTTYVESIEVKSVSSGINKIYDLLNKFWFSLAQIGVFNSPYVWPKIMVERNKTAIAMFDNVFNKIKITKP